MLLFIYGQAGAAQTWGYSVSLGTDPHIGLADEPYRSLTSSGGGGGNGPGGSSVDLADAVFDLDYSLQFAVTAERTFTPLTSGWVPSFQGSFVVRETAITFPDGVRLSGGSLTLVDPLKLSSTSFGVDVRGAMESPVFYDRYTVQVGAGAVVLRITDNFDYGFLQAENKRTETLPYGFVRAQARMIETANLDVSGYVETSFSRLGPSWALGLEQKF
ncbi:hypothetical protein L0664_12390 [Octadecabacter sp. G9-8]|uniref:Outer membrane protein beta-barrel domain-containing protein n=2 Tax=Octadecabacter dasysiphoniae TaxID=2909341 RepID=A0ABS9CYG9_9RHOB|nr:hypothetical protein [Octadecabacter dasysiphoniae]